MYLMHICFNPSDEEIEVSINSSYAIRSFRDIDSHEQQVPDATTLLKFKHMLVSNKLGEKLFADINSRLDKAGLMMHDVTEFYIIISIIAMIASFVLKLSSTTYAASISISNASSNSAIKFTT